MPEQIDQFIVQRLEMYMINIYQMRVYFILTWAILVIYNVFYVLQAYELSDELNG